MRDRVRSPIAHFMTPDPSCIGRKERLAGAHERMRSLHVRHLPVVEEGRLVGLVSERDLLFVESIRERGPQDVLVEDAMTSDVYVVPPDRPVGEVAAKMVELKCGCAVIAEEGRLVGIFTTTDALRVVVGIVEAWV